MATLRYLALVSLGIAFFIGCGDSSTRSWERAKSRSSGEQKTPRIDTPADNDDATPAAEPDNPPKMVNPHGGMNPHSGMQMPAGGSDVKLENTGKLDFDSVHFTVPKSWVPKAHSPMFQAEFAIPRAEGDQQDGRLTVGQFGGTLEDNVDRWKKQFGNKPDKENEETLDAGGVKIVLVDFTGTFSDSSGPMMMAGPSVSHPDYRMFGAIFPVPGGDRLCVVKCYGSKKTITARADEIKGFLRSLKVDK